MDGPANDVVTPGRVVVSIGLLRQGINAFVDVCPLGVAASASDLSESTNLQDAKHLLGRRNERTRSFLDPGIEVGNPGVVSEDCPLLVEPPKGDLVVKSAKRDGLEYSSPQRTCFRGASALPCSGDPGFTTLQYKYTTEAATSLQPELNSTIL